MLSDKKILVTGPSGNIAFPLCRALAKDNEVWGIGRLANPQERAKVEAAGVTTRQIDLGEGDFGGLPDDFHYVLHLAAYVTGRDFDAGVRFNAEGTGLLLTHCRKAKAALVMSTCGVYRANPDPWHAYAETDPLGDPVSPHPDQVTYGLTKNIEEGVARMCARQLGLPTIIARMNAAYGVEPGGHSVLNAHFDLINAGQPVQLRSDPQPYSPIHDRDIFAQLPALLDAASVPATIVNWGGDEGVAAQDWCAYYGQLLGVEPNIVVKPIPGSQPGVIADNKKRLSITGPCQVSWREGAREVAESRLGPLRN